VLALVADLLPAQRHLDDVGVLAGARQRLVEAHAVPALRHLRPETPSPRRKRPPDSVSSVAAVIAQFAACGRDLEDRRADVHPRGLRRDEGEDGRRVGAVRLRHPRHRVAEVVGLLREREVVGVVAAAPVAEVHAELHRSSRWRSSSAGYRGAVDYGPSA
jgi:hypothetical protein